MRLRKKKITKQALALAIAASVAVSVPVTANAVDYDADNGTVHVSTKKTSEDDDAEEHVVSWQDKDEKYNSYDNSYDHNTANDGNGDNEINIKDSDDNDASSNTKAIVEVDENVDGSKISEGKDSLEINIEKVEATVADDNNKDNVEDAVEINGDNIDVTIKDSTIKVEDSGADGVEIGKDASNVNVTLDGATISANSGAGIDVQSGAKEDGTADTTIELANDNTVTGGNDHAGVEVNTGAAVEIKDDADTDGKGKLNATGGAGGAGIGGAAGEGAGNIVIDGAEIDALGKIGDKDKTGYDGSGSGIGAGSNGKGGTITIQNGAVVKAEVEQGGPEYKGGTNGGSGIGGDETVIKIKNSTITKAQGGWNGSYTSDDATEAGAGIGGKKADVTITEGSVIEDAEGGSTWLHKDSGDGIGGDSSTVVIDGGSKIVKAKGGNGPGDSWEEGGVSTGSGIGGRNATVTIKDDNTVIETAEGGYLGFRTDGTVCNGTNSNAGAGIGGNGATVNITGGTIKNALGGRSQNDGYSYGGVGIGGYANSAKGDGMPGTITPNATVNISGATIENIKGGDAESGTGGAGIAGSNINIKMGSGSIGNIYGGESENKTGGNGIWGGDIVIEDSRITDIIAGNSDYASIDEALTLPFLGTSYPHYGDGGSGIKGKNITIKDEGTKIDQIVGYGSGSGITATSKVEIIGANIGSAVSKSGLTEDAIKSLKSKFSNDTEYEKWAQIVRDKNTGAGINGDDDLNTSVVTISGAKIGLAQGGEAGGAGIGGTSEGKTGTISIIGSTVDKITAGAGAAAVGGGYSGTVNGDITITDSSIVANGGDNHQTVKTVCTDSNGNVILDTLGGYVDINNTSSIRVAIESASENTPVVANAIGSIKLAYRGDEQTVQTYTYRYHKVYYYSNGEKLELKDSEGNNIYYVETIIKNESYTILKTEDGQRVYAYDSKTKTKNEDYTGEPTSVTYTTSTSFFSKTTDGSTKNKLTINSSFLTSCGFKQSDITTDDGGGAGIGSGANGTAKGIIIDGTSKVEANGGLGAAGIGGGSGGSVDGGISVLGTANVTAKGGAAKSTQHKMYVNSEGKALDGVNGSAVKTVEEANEAIGEASRSEEAVSQDYHESSVTYNKGTDNEYTQKTTGYYRYFKAYYYVDGEKKPLMDESGNQLYYRDVADDITTTYKDGTSTTEHKETFSGYCLYDEETKKATKWIYTFAYNSTKYKRNLGYILDANGFILKDAYSTSGGGAGIGSGVNGSIQSISVSGDVDVSAYGGAGGAGIGTAGGTGDITAPQGTISVELGKKGKLLAVGGENASGIGGGENTKGYSGKPVDNCVESISIANSGEVRAFADGTKFAVDITSGTDTSGSKGVLNGRFIEEDDSDDTSHGLSKIEETLLNIVDGTGETITKIKLPVYSGSNGFSDAKRLYNSFATNLGDYAGKPVYVFDGSGDLKTYEGSIAGTDKYQTAYGGEWTDNNDEAKLNGGRHVDLGNTADAMYNADEMQFPRYTQTYIFNYTNEGYESLHGYDKVKEQLKQAAEDQVFTIDDLKATVSGTYGLNSVTGTYEGTDAEGNKGTYTYTWSYGNGWTPTNTSGAINANGDLTDMEFEATWTYSETFEKTPDPEPTPDPKPEKEKKEKKGDDDIVPVVPPVVPVVPADTTETTIPEVVPVAETTTTPVTPAEPVAPAAPVDTTPKLPQTGSAWFESIGLAVAGLALSLGSLFGKGKHEKE